MSVAMMCACTGRCKVWPYTCNGIADIQSTQPYINPPMPVPVPHPVGAEKTCEGLACPRRNPFQMRGRHDEMDEAWLASIIAAAPRESEEQASGEIRALRKALHDETMKRLASAEEMRERAAQVAAKYDATSPSNVGNIHPDYFYGQENAADGIADAIRALPLTPEEPPKRQPVAPSADPDVSVCGRLIASHPIKEPE